MGATDFSASAISLMVVMRSAILPVAPGCAATAPFIAAAASARRLLSPVSYVCSLVSPIGSVPTVGHASPVRHGAVAGRQWGCTMAAAPRCGYRATGSPGHLARPAQRRRAPRSPGRKWRRHGNAGWPCRDDRGDDPPAMPGYPVPSACLGRATSQVWQKDHAKLHDQQGHDNRQECSATRHGERALVTGSRDCTRCPPRWRWSNANAPLQAGTGAVPRVVREFFGCYHGCCDVIKNTTSTCVFLWLHHEYSFLG